MFGMPMGQPQMSMPMGQPGQQMPMGMAPPMQSFGQPMGMGAPGAPFGMGQPMGGFGGQMLPPFGQPMGGQMGAPMGAPQSFAPPAHMMQQQQQPPADGAPAPAGPGPVVQSHSYTPPMQPAVMNSAPQYVQNPGMSMVQQPFGQPFGQQPFGQPQYGQPQVVARVVQQPQQQQAPIQQKQEQQEQPAEDPITVAISGRDGVNDVMNSLFQCCGEHGERYCFSAPTNEGPIFLYFDAQSDNWCIGDQIGSQSYYAVCGPSNGEDMAQEWRIWNGETWENDSKVIATIK